MGNTRLTPDIWLDAGFDALQKQGAQALAAEPLARHLGTTKGSFYWHFRDVPTFQDALLTKWQETAVAAIDALAQTDAQADLQLRSLGRYILADPNETPLRVWAHHEPRTATVLAEVDALRLATVTRLLGSLGLRNADFANALQSSLIGLPMLAPADKVRAFDTLIDTVLALADD